MRTHRRSVVIEAQTSSGRPAVAAGSLAMRSRMCHLDRQSPRGRVGWLCGTNNGGRVCDSLRALQDSWRRRRDARQSTKQASLRSTLRRNVRGDPNPTTTGTRAVVVTHTFLARSTHDSLHQGRDGGHTTHQPQRHQHSAPQAPHSCVMPRGSAPRGGGFAVSSHSARDAEAVRAAQPTPRPRRAIRGVHQSAHPSRCGPLTLDSRPRRLEAQA